MKRPRILILAGWLGFTLLLSAEPPRDLNKIIPVQRAIVAAREALRLNDPAKAIRILEAEQANAVGNTAYASLLKDAKEALAKTQPGNPADIIEPDDKQTPTLKLPPTDLAVRPVSSATLAPPLPPPPPVEETVKEPVAPPERFPEPEPKPLPIIVNPPKADVDPFQQTPSHGRLPGNDLSKADAAFAAKKYAQAATLYQQAAKQGLKLTPEQQEQWIYCRLFNVATQLKSGTVDEAQRGVLLREVADCRQSGSERLHDFCDRLTASLRPATASAPTPTVAGDSRNFAIKGVADPVKAGEVIQVADAVRAAMYQRWSGTTANDWATPCEITLHACGKDYRQVTHKPESLWGHSTVGVRGIDVVTRKLDLCGDDLSLLDVTLPNEITQMILLEMYAEQPLPKWALIGMAALSETPESVARYRRTVPGLLRDRKLLMLSVLLEQQTFPEPEATTAFYAQSISLVSFLVEKKGCKAFATFLREAPRRGIAKALQSHYGFKDVADLQQQWLKSLSVTQ
ncbi:hypothetical protein [Zavarzinella formosa]|uniref:hypothetical protein n=1 Tax=Zavarzinella formosa TaxID=360055 RepID=UPI0002F8C919|nr:hypothetical protein [Zavarzinella formosa]